MKKEINAQTGNRRYQCAPGEIMDQGGFLQKRYRNHAKHCAERERGIISASLWDHFIEPIRGRFPKAELTTQQSRSNPARVIHVVQRCVAREIKGEHCKEGHPGCHRKLPGAVTP